MLSLVAPIVVLLLLVAAALPTEATQGGAISPSVALPAPTGPFPVGRAVYHWRDATRDEFYSDVPGDRRELVVSVWYPAAPDPSATPGPYASPGWEAVGDFWGFGTDGARGHAYPEAPVAAGQARYPVLIFTANGFPPFNHAAIIEELASHGYVVVGINNTYQTPVTVFPDGRAVPVSPAFLTPFFGPFVDPTEEVLRQRAALVDYKVADIQSVLRELERLNAGTDRLAGRLDLSRLGALGHSMGGDASLEFCRIDRRCRAAANLDGAHWTAVGRLGLTVPALRIAADHVETSQPCVDSAAYPAALCEADRVAMVDGWRVVDSTAQPSYVVTVRGAVHSNFLDVPFLPLHPDGIMQAGLAPAAIDGERMWRITCDYLLAFFAKHLDGASAPLLDGPSPGYPEVTFGPPSADHAAGRS